MKRPFHNWTSEDHASWRLLVERQLPNLQQYGSHTWLNGWEKLGMNQDSIPDFARLNITNWQLISSPLGFADGQTWFETLKKQEFLITEYIRPHNNLDYTPMPDVFHDAFGHLPFLVDAQITRIIQLFTKAILKADPKTRKKLGRWWWYSIEFGLVKENDAIKVLGAGLASSFGELSRTFAGETIIRRFDPEEVGTTPQSSDTFHKRLFVLDSLDALETLIKPYAMTATITPSVNQD